VSARLTAEALRAELVAMANADEPWQIIQERRLTDLEHALVSRRFRRRLRRNLLRRARQFARVGPDFRARRMEDVGNEALCWPARKDEAA
jgi:hypothetical protein